MSIADRTNLSSTHPENQKNDVKKFLKKKKKDVPNSNKIVV